jgi:hypothetical protein
LSFSAIEHPGLDNWLISGQIGDCSDPSDIGVTIDGAVTASATTDIFGYFEVIVTYSGPVDEITADADYEGVPIPQAFAEIGT